MLRQFGRFALVGAVGFLVDVAVLSAVVSTGLVGLYAGRVALFLAAATVTWLINRRVTFAATGATSAGRQWLGYVGAMMGGGAVNYATYAVVIHLAGETIAAAPPAVAAGSLAGLAVNFVAARRLVFARRDR